MDVLGAIWQVVLLLSMFGTYLVEVMYVPFLLGLYSVRLRFTVDRLWLTGFDPEASMWAGFAIWPLATLGFHWGASVGWISLLGAALLWLSFRVRVRVSPRGTWMLRCLAWVIPWRIRHTSTTPLASVDGWGDFMDPEALWLADTDGGWTLQLGWSNARSGDRATELARAINRAVATILEP